MARKTRSSINADIDVLSAQIQTYKRREEEFQRLIDDLQKLKDEVTEERSAAEAQRKELEALKEPINWLPPELLAQIFGELVDMDHKEVNYRPAMVVSQVCDKWRTIAISSPSLWRRFFLRGFGQPGIFKLYMTRSANVPIDLDYRSNSDDMPTKEMMEVAAYLSKSLKHIRRAASFSLQCKSAPALSYIFPPINDHLKNFPILRSLNLSITTQSPVFSEVPHILEKEKDIIIELDAGSKVYVQNNSPLTRLRLEEVPLFSIPLTLIANLRFLELSFSPKATQSVDHYHLKMSSLCRFLTFTPFLEELTLANTVPDFDVSSPASDGSTADNSVTGMKPVKLNHLKTIDWTWPYTGDVFRFLSLIDAPALEKLDLWVEDLPQKRPEPYHHAWRNAQILSSLQDKYLCDAITYPALRDLSLQCAGDDSTTSVLRKFAFPALEKVAFTNVVTAHAERPGATHHLPYFPRLESIFRDPRLPNLTHLTLSHFKISSEPGRVEALFGYTPFLTSLSLEACTGVERLMEALKKQYVGAISPLFCRESTSGVIWNDGRGGNESLVEDARLRPQRGVKVCPRLEALSFWGCQDVDLTSIRAVVISRNRSVTESSAADSRTSNGMAGTPNGAIPSVTRNLRDGNASVTDGHGHTTSTTEDGQMERKIKPLRKSRHHPVESCLTSSADGIKELVAPSTNIASSIIARQEAFRPANIIYLRMVNCPLISKEEAASLRDLGVVDVIWAGSA
ncbi:hypothetical protein CVT26_004713 [Gymnopilus dilepis]|uniref:F-box domain-containing protein n=1 Tax=Gymnopilus dilepis TaxID=231916 RepID=A0A409XZD7_9AGAR|nr:hypothetical protein CVT26_004713 [Gymnopilus dilepis]